MNNLLQKHLKRKLKDLYQEVNKVLNKFNFQEKEIKRFKEEKIGYEVTFETYKIMFPNWEDLETLDDSIYEEIISNLRLIEILKEQITILEKSNTYLEDKISTLRSKIVSLNVDMNWIRDDEGYDYE